MSKFKAIQPRKCTHNWHKSIRLYARVRPLKYASTIIEKKKVFRNTLHYKV